MLHESNGDIQDRHIGAVLLYLREVEAVQDKLADPFYLSPAWRRARVAALLRDHGMCVRCMQRFRAGGAKPRPATLVHHIKHYKDCPELALELDNLESLCDACHNKAHPEKAGGRLDEELPGACRGVRVIKI